MWFFFSSRMFFVFFDMYFVERSSSFFSEKYTFFVVLCVCVFFIQSSCNFVWFLFCSLTLDFNFSSLRFSVTFPIVMLFQYGRSAISQIVSKVQPKKNAENFFLWRPRINDAAAAVVCNAFDILLVDAPLVFSFVFPHTQKIQILYAEYIKWIERTTTSTMTKKMMMWWWWRTTEHPNQENKREKISNTFNACFNFFPFNDSSLWHTQFFSMMIIWMVDSVQSQSVSVLVCFFFFNSLAFFLFIVLRRNSLSITYWPKFTIHTIRNSFITSHLSKHSSGE